MVDGIRAGIRKIDERKGWYRANGISYYRPWLVLISDGAPYVPGGRQDIEGIGEEIRLANTGKHLAFLPMGVEGADYKTLNKLSTPEFPPLPIDWQKFDKVFEWLSNSLDKVSQSAEGENVSFGSVQDFTRNGWGGGNFTQVAV